MPLTDQILKFKVFTLTNLSKNLKPVTPIQCQGQCPPHTHPHRNPWLCDKQQSDRLCVSIWFPSIVPAISLQKLTVWLLLQSLFYVSSITTSHWHQSYQSSFGNFNVNDVAPWHFTKHSNYQTRSGNLGPFQQCGYTSVALLSVRSCFYPIGASGQGCAVDCPVQWPPCPLSCHQS